MELKQEKTVQDRPYLEENTSGFSTNNNNFTKS